MAKLPKGVKTQLDTIQDECIPFVASHIPRIIAEDETLPKWIAEKGADYYRGMLQGHYAMIEALLSEYKCYRGFRDEDGYRVYFF